MVGIFAAVLTSATTVWSCAIRSVLSVLFLPIIFVLSPGEAQTIWVPDDQPTIRRSRNEAQLVRSFRRAGLCGINRFVKRA